MQSGTVYLKTVPIVATSNDDVEDFSDAYSGNSTTSPSFDGQQQQVTEITADSSNASSNSLPVWLVWNSHESDETDTKM